MNSKGLPNLIKVARDAGERLCVRVPARDIP